MAARKKAARKKVAKKQVGRKRAAQRPVADEPLLSVHVPYAPPPESDPRMQRKRRTEAWLAARGIPFIDHLPPIEGEDEVHLRAPEEVARRARLLFAISAVGYELDGEDEFVDRLKREGTWTHATPRERRFLAGRGRTKQAMIDATWGLDAVWTLLWALRAVDDLGVPETDKTPREVQPHLPSVFDPIDGFLAAHRSLRPASELLDETDRAYRLHWAARPWRETRVDGLCPGAVRERHKALNWLIGADGAESWDDVETNT